MRPISISAGIIMAIAATALAAMGQAQSQAPTLNSPPMVTSTVTAREKAWSILKAGLSDKATERRTAAVRALGLISADPEAVQIAEHSLSDPKIEVRAAAATSLGQMGATSSIPSLKEKLSDPEPSVVLAVAHALWALKDPAAYDVYYAVLTGKRKADNGKTAEGMETFKDPKKAALFGFEEGIGFIPFAGLGYTAVKALIKDDSSPVRAGAAVALANDPDPNSADALITASKDKSWVVRSAALDALGKRGDPALLSRVVPAMADEKHAVQYTAAATVIRLSDIAEARKAPEMTPPIQENERASRKKRKKK